MSHIELLRDTLAGMQTIERAIVEGVSRPSRLLKS